MNKRLILTIIVALLCYLSYASLTFDIQVSAPLLRNNEFSNDLPVKLIPGEPQIAYHDLRILLPQGHRFISAEITFGREHTENNIYVNFAGDPQPISQPVISETRANPVIYEADSYFPAERLEILGVQRKNGHDILILNVYPYSYNPVRSELKWFDGFELTIQSEYDREIAGEQNLFLVQSERIEAELSRLVLNPEQMFSYRKDFFRTESILPSADEPYQMIIISDNIREPLFTDFIEWKESKGITTGYFQTNDIYPNYPGVDNQTKIRNFIIDAYQTYSQTSTPLEYVILGGDSRIIPIRGLFGQVGGTVDQNMPADIYYSNLDGTWDANGNGIYGETSDNIDWFAEVAIGRIPAFTTTEFNNFFHKSMFYVDNNTYANDIVYMMGENLDSRPTWGGDYKDEIVPYIPADYHIDSLYERDGTFSISEVIRVFNDGLGYLNHIGHANQSVVFGLNNARVASLTNNQYGFAYTQGCYPAAFDPATSQESGCVGQNLVTASGGLFAFIGNTRYGWYMPGSTNGPSQAFDLTFFAGLYGENIRELGHTMNYSKEQLVNQAMNSGVMRWCYYELILFGDPSIAVKDPNGTFPYVEPGEVVYNDIMGDNDGMVNPGETVHIYLELENLPAWADAYDVTATISFNTDFIDVINGSVNYGNIAHSTSANNTAEPFIIEVASTIPYNNYTMSVAVSALGEDTAIFNKTYKILMPITLIQNHWPWSSSYPISASPLFTDFTGDSSKELVIVDALGNINLLDAEANTLQDPLLNQENLWRSFSMGDITNNGELEIVIASRLNRILAIDKQGDLVFSFEDCGQQILTPVIADINNDGVLEIISFGLDKVLYVLDNTGNLLDGFPLELPSTSVADIAVADLNNDGYKEIIIGTLDGNIYALNYDGTDHPGFPVKISAGVLAAPIVLDNGNIAIGTSNNRLYFVSSTGEIIFSKQLPNRISTEIIAADFSNNGELELAFVTNNGTLHIVKQNGEYLEGWPVNLNEPFLQPPLAVDLNGDNSVNLIAYSSQGKVFAFNADGTPVDTFPVPLNTSITSPATIADIDNDGDWDIVLASTNGIIVVDYKQPMGQRTPWTMYRGNLQRTGFYGDNQTTDIDIPFSEYVTALNQNYPNPFNPQTRIDFTLHSSSKMSLEIFNIKGQKVKTLLNEYLQEGEHSVLWNGTNNQNKTVGAGIYFYRLTTPDTSLTRKMLLLK